MKDETLKKIDQFFDNLTSDNLDIFLKAIGFGKYETDNSLYFELKKELYGDDSHYIVPPVEVDSPSYTALLAPVEIDLSSYTALLAPVEIDLSSYTALLAPVEIDLSSYTALPAPVETDLSSYRTAVIISENFEFESSCTVDFLSTSSDNNKTIFDLEVLGLKSNLHDYSRAA